MTAPANVRYETIQAFDAAIDQGDGEKKPHINVSIRVVEGPNTGANHTWRGYLSPAALPYTLANLRKLGWTGTKVSKVMQEGLGTLKARAQFKTEIWEGKAREKVNGFYEIKPMGIKVDNPIEAGDLEAFDALFESAAEVIECVAVNDLSKAGALPPTVKKAPAQANPNDLGY